MLEGLEVMRECLFTECLNACTSSCLDIQSVLAVAVALLCTLQCRSKGNGNSSRSRALIAQGRKLFSGYAGSGYSDVDGGSSSSSAAFNHPFFRLMRLYMEHYLPRPAGLNVAAAKASQLGLPLGAAGAAASGQGMLGAVDGLAGLTGASPLGGGQLGLCISCPPLICTTTSEHLLQGHVWQA